MPARCRERAAEPGEKAAARHVTCGNRGSRAAGEAAKKAWDGVDSGTDGTDGLAATPRGRKRGQLLVILLYTCAS